MRTDNRLHRVKRVDQLPRVQNWEGGVHQPVMNGALKNCKSVPNTATVKIFGEMQHLIMALSSFCFPTIFPPHLVLSPKTTLLFFFTNFLQILTFLNQC